MNNRIAELKSLLPRCMLPDWVRLGARATRLLAAGQPESQREAALERLLLEARESAEFRERRRLQAPLVAYPESLPITARRADIVGAIRANQVVVLAGETGSGKTTQIPKMCLEAGLGISAMIGCTQPRRVAALSISQRIAEELNVPWGREVGCKIRFDDRSGPETYIKLMTDGILLAETQGDPLLSDYNALIIDEAHERSLNIDFLLGYLKGLIARRKDLKLVVTSATIDTELFSRHFGNAPILEVSGRNFPVEVVYAPEGNLDQPTGPEPSSGDEADVDFVGAAVRAAESALIDSGEGDMLIFMPGERDIRECADQLGGRFGGLIDVVPLYGRLSAGDQHRVFEVGNRRKVVVATNIAETSLTIPGIRFVIDSGLARISHYNPRSRTKRLPVEPVSQSSANQRKGRAGRVQAGVCIRLYSEESFLARPAFTPPEIQRANLAEVILRMVAFGLGDIETFPFLQPPSPAAISGGFALLQELGALDGERQLTDIGRELARLPIDPSLGRMLLQSREENAVAELLIIAAGLSIQDPRERPLEQREAAEAAHRRHVDPRSDFLGLLKLWQAVHEPWGELRTQGARRRFCRQNFLSYTRVQEWQEVHSQLEEALEEPGGRPSRPGGATYEAIHRSVLAGLLGHVARREERNQYKAAGNREVIVFPGSALFEKGERPARGGARQAKPAEPAPQKSKAPEWIVAGEIVETSQRFARTIAGIESQWILQLAPHLCRKAHLNPHWSPEAGRVLVEEVVTFQGFEVQRHKVSYANLNAKDATAIFIRSALVEEALFPAKKQVSRHEVGEEELDETEDGEGEPNVEEAFRRFPFLARNRSVRHKVETWQTRMRHHQLNLDHSLFEFYASRLGSETVASLAELNRFVNGAAGRDALCVTEADLVGDRDLAYDDQAFPDALTLAGQEVPLAYAYAPGEENDGVTIRLPVDLIREVSPAMVFWAVPGLRPDQARELLEGLPGSLRRQLQPFRPKIPEIARDLAPAASSLAATLSGFVKQRYAVETPYEAWKVDAVPAHLRPRVEIVDTRGRVIGAGRDLNALRTQLEQQIARSALKVPGDAPFWRQAAERWERPGMTGWTCGDLPARVVVHDGPGPAVYAWPGLKEEDGAVSVRLFRTEGSAREASLAGVGRLVELAIQKDLAWLERDLRLLARPEFLDPTLGPPQELQESALRALKRYLLPARPLEALSGAKFQEAVDQARKRLPGLGQQMTDRIRTLIQLRRQIQERLGPAASAKAAPAKARTLTDFSQLGFAPATAAPANPLADELASLMPPRFLEGVPFERLHHHGRYLKALLLRIERAAANPPKDQERARLAAPWAAALRQCDAAPAPSWERRRRVEEFRWMIEEYKVSLFAQELGTATPVSPKRLEEQWERIRQVD